MAIGKIDGMGNLWIQRGDEIKAVKCPYCSRADISWEKCGDWCAEFGEPRPSDKKIFDGRSYGYPDHPDTVLSLCHGVWHFEKFMDERKHENVEAK